MSDDDDDDVCMFVWIGGLMMYVCMNICIQQLGAELGRGGFGAVFQALNIDTG